MDSEQPRAAPPTPVPAAGVQGWLFDRPPQDAECTPMKPTRRLGKGLAALVELHSGTIGTSADDGESGAGGSVLHLLSTEPLGRPGQTPGPSPATQAAVAAAVQAANAEFERRSVVAPEPPPAPAQVAAPVPPSHEALVPDSDAPPEPPSQIVADGFEDEWFDPPIAAFSPASGFERVASAAPPPPSTPPAPVAAEPPPPPSPVERAPAPVSQPLPSPALLDDPVIVDDGLFFDDVVVGDFLPDVDLDS